MSDTDFSKELSTVTLTDEKQALIDEIETLRPSMKALADYIFDHPELGNEEFQAYEKLTNLLASEGFQVEHGISGLKTAFKATYEIGEGGPNIGLLCEYDALEGLGHACGHHMQGPSIVSAAIGLCRKLTIPCNLIVLGTPAEETKSGKLVMAKDGVFDDLDVAFMMHGSDSTTVDGKSLALNLINFNFYGKAAHAAIAPEQGISALDAVLLFFNGMEYLREHVTSDVKMHGIITNGGKAANIVPDFASTQWYVRGESRPSLDRALEKVYKVAEGAALQVGARLEIVEEKAYDNKFNAPLLNAIILKNAELIGIPDITPPRKKTGSTDFSSVTYRVPGACLRVKYVDRGVSSHSQGWLDRGKTDWAENVIMNGAKGIAMTVYDLLSKPELLEDIQEQFKKDKAAVQ